MIPFLKQEELIFIESVRERADVVLFRAHQKSLKAFVELAVRDLEHALKCLGVENSEQSASLLREATRLTDLAADRVEVAEKALREWGPDASLLALEIPSSGKRRSVS